MISNLPTAILETIIEKQRFELSQFQPKPHLTFGLSRELPPVSSGFANRAHLTWLPGGKLRPRRPQAIAHCSLTN